MNGSQTELSPATKRQWNDAVAGAQPWVRLGMGIVAIFFGLGGAWLALAPLNGAIIAQGSIVVDSYRKKVQHLEGGIVKEVLVRPGMMVEKGQPMLLLQDVEADASVEILQDQLDTENIRAARLEAERLQQDGLRYPPDLLARAKHRRKLAKLIDTERTLFVARKQQLDGQVAILRRQIIEVKDELTGLERQFHSAGESAGLIGEELAMSETLRQGNFVQKTQVLGLKRTLSEKQERRGEFQAQIAQSRQKISELELRVIGLRDAYVKEASDELKEANRRILDVQQRLRPTSDLLLRRVVIAPVAGEVVDVRQASPGEVIAPRDVIAEIVPTARTLIMEGKVRIEDIAHLKVGDPVAVQLSAYKQRVTPLVDGKLVYVSADSLQETVQGTPTAYYKVQAAITEDALKAAGNPRLTPGMPAVLFIQTRARTALDYLIEPVTDTLRRSFREF